MPLCTGRISLFVPLFLHTPETSDYWVLSILILAVSLPITACFKKSDTLDAFSQEIYEGEDIFKSSNIVLRVGN